MPGMTRRAVVLLQLVQQPEEYGQPENESATVATGDMSEESSEYVCLQSAHWSGTKSAFNCNNLNNLLSSSNLVK
jgi:hypothetical protein